MNLVLKQTESAFTCGYDLIKNNAVIAKATLSDNLTGYGQLDFDAYFEKAKFRMCYMPLTETVMQAKSVKIYSIYEIFDCCGNKIGQVSSQGVKMFDYICVEYKNYTFNIYTVGLGSEGIKYPVYYNTQQVALIEKDCVVKNNLDEYSITSIDEFTGYIAYIAALFIDETAYANRGEKVKKSTQKYYLKTTNKELKAKYNPDFKDFVNKNCI